MGIMGLSLNLLLMELCVKFVILCHMIAGFGHAIMC